MKTMKFDDIKDIDLSSHSYNHIPEEVYRMVHLESIKLGNGNEIQVSDRYKLMDAIPTIKTIDDNDVSQIRSGITNLNSIFVRRLQEMFLTKAASEIYFEEISEEARIEKMVSLAKMTIGAGPEVLKDFKDYKIEKLIRENYEVYVSEALEVTVKLKEEKENKGPPAKKKKGALNTKGKMKLKQTPSMQQPISTVSKLSTDICSNLKLERLVRTHSRNNDQADTETKVWMCEFEPDTQELGKTTNILATCGGDSICYINCEAATSSELVVKKFQCPNENFYCIAWTIHTTSEGDSITILAAGGTQGTVKIIDASENRIECYDCTRNKKSVDCMVFHSTVSHWLFTGSEDKTISLWDFSKQFGGEKSNPPKLAVFKPPTNGPIRQISVVPHGKIVFGACDEAVYAWEVEPTLCVMNRPLLYKLKFKNKKDFFIDATTVLTNNLLAVKRVGEGNIQLFHSSSEFFKDDASIVYSLRWSNTTTPFLKFNFTTGTNVLLAGDDEGYVWLYNLNELVLVAKKSKVIKLSHDIFAKKIRFKQRSSSDLNHPEKMLFNHVTCSTSLQHVIAVCDNNLVAIWKQCI